MSRVLIIGANREIGLGLVDVHLEDVWEVHATTRDGSAPRPGYSHTGWTYVTGTSSKPWSHTWTAPRIASPGS